MTYGDPTYSDVGVEVSGNDVPSVDVFYDQLAPHGTWFEDPSFGWVFAPLDGGYVPYTNGRWTSTDYGFTWVSNDPFGWATDHYGRWVWSNRWVWRPDTTWGPAWVQWRQGDGYVGWAPLGYSDDAYFPEDHWRFLPATYVLAADSPRYLIRGPVRSYLSATWTVRRFGRDQPPVRGGACRRGDRPGLCGGPARGAGGALAAPPRPLPGPRRPGDRQPRRAQGRLALDTPVLQYLPQGYRHAFNPLHPDLAAQSDAVTDPRLGAVTVRMLLQHTAALPNWAGGPLRFEGTPGERWSYSGEGYVLLQRAVETVMRRPLDEVMQALVFDPLGMGHSNYRWTPRIGEHLLPGTHANGAPRKQVLMNQPVAAYSLYTTADDYARFVIAWLRDPALQAMTAESPVDVDTGLNLAWGLGWGLETSTDGTRFWQWGNNPGYRAFVLAEPVSGDALVLLTNSDAGLELVEPLVRSHLPGEHKVLRSSFLSAGVFERLCKVLRVCL